MTSLENKEVELTELVQMNIYQSNTYWKDLGWSQGFKRGSKWKINETKTFYEFISHKPSEIWTWSLYHFNLMDSGRL